jgi:hypothetical protein
MHNSILLIGCLLGLVLVAVQSFVPSFRHEFRSASAPVVSLAAAKKRKRKTPPVTTPPGAKVDVASTQPLVKESVAKDVMEDVDEETITEIANFKFEPDDAITKGTYIYENAERKKRDI